MFSPRETPANTKRWPTEVPQPIKEEVKSHWMGFTQLSKDLKFEEGSSNVAQRRVSVKRVQIMRLKFSLSQCQADHLG